MAVMKVVELMGQSTVSWEDAVKQVVDEASKTIRNIRSVYVKHFMAEVHEDGTLHYRVDCKLTFKVE
jgi:flavin-binding protein dodecin